MAKVGGKRPGAGRPKGSVNRATVQARATISEIARQYTDVAVKTLADIAEHGESDAARVSAAVALLDRAYGKPPQAMELTGRDGGPINIGATLKMSELTRDERDVLREILSRRAGESGSGAPGA